MTVKAGDILAFLITLSAIVAGSLYVYTDSGQGAVVEIQTREDNFLYPLAQDQLLEMPGPLGVTRVSIDKQEARFIDSPCRDKNCVLAGPVKLAGQWNACLPNLVLVRIRGGDSAKKQTDAISY